MGFAQTVRATTVFRSRLRADVRSGECRRPSHAVPARVARRLPARLVSRRPRQGRLFSPASVAVPARVRRPGSPAVPASQSRQPLSPPECRPPSLPGPARVARQVPASPPSGSSPVHRARQVARRSHQSCPSADPARAVPRQVVQRRPVPPESSGVPARVVCQAVSGVSPPPSPRQGRPPCPPESSAKLFLDSPPESSTKSPPASSAVPARVAIHARVARRALCSTSRPQIRVPNFTIVPHG